MTAESAAVRGAHATMTKPISVAKTLRAAFAFLTTRTGAVLRLAVVPLILGWATLYLSLYAYLAELSLFLHSPNGQVGSQALGLVAAGFFVTLLLHCVLAIGLAELALGLPRRSKLFFRAGHSEWRLYAAYLRVVMLAAGAIAVPMLLAWSASRLLAAGGHGDDVRWVFLAAYGTILAALTVLSVRIRFLMAPIVVMEQGPVLRRSLALSSGISWRLFAVAIVCIAPGILVQSASETGARAMGLLPPVVPGASFQALVDQLRAILPEFVTITMAAYFVTLILLVGAAASVYRTRTEGPS